ncbi:chitin synthase chs-2-like isoform X2 [Agrilus planipennis]|uniref:Chitin synthase chs-2-like isoform X2 n=1 Tax=Agrilus planipennis TaxID=224129 RepID=A0A7F5RIL1_AGRPL|nr:chitin synthase chs-2-like isoform X2 [Agrilus planipennis]
MLFHRFGTIAHILAATELNWCCTKKKEDLSPNALLDRQAVEIVKQLQKLQGIDDPDYDNDSGSGPDRIGRRKTIHNIEKAAHRKRQIGTLDVAFKKRFAKLNQTGVEGTPVLSRKLTMGRETMKALEVRINSVMAERKKSQMQTLGAKNEYGNNNVLRSHRNSTASIPLQDVFENGHVNRAFEEDDSSSKRTSLPMHTRNNANWKGLSNRL